jgi:hypothetical protein
MSNALLRMSCLRHELRFAHERPYMKNHLMRKAQLTRKRLTAQQA